MTPDDGAAPYQQQLVNELAGDGHLTDPWWREAFSAVPRHLFVPDFFDLTDDGLWEPVTIDRTPRRLLEQVYSDRTCVTQLDGAITAADTDSTIDGEPTSSSTEPGLIADMLHSLDVHDGHRVMEVGTGTGYNAALLCHRLGADQVQSVEVDPAVAADAADRLHQIGYHPTLSIGDGGSADGSKVDRLIATCSFPNVPPHWVGLVAPGGVIVTTVYVKPHGMALVKLTVDPNGTAGEFIVPGASFMPARTARPTQVRTAHPDDVAAAQSRSSRWPMPTHDTFPANFLAGWVLGDAIHFTADEDTPALLVDQRTWSWVAFGPDDGQIREGGSRRMWQEAEHLLDAWQDTDRDDLAGFRYEVGTGPDGTDMLVSRSTGRSWPRRPY